MINVMRYDYHGNGRIVLDPLGRYVSYDDYTLALSRIEAAEALIELKDEYYLNINDYDDGELSDMEFKIRKAFLKWESTIRAMEGEK